MGHRRGKQNLEESSASSMLHGITAKEAAAAEP